MASVNGEYVGPLEPEDADRILDDLSEGKPVLKSKQLRYLRCADPGVETAGEDFSPPSKEDTAMADTASLPSGGEHADRPGPTAPIEMPPDELEEGEDE
jgi:hypothetical protein